MLQRQLAELGPEEQRLRAQRERAALDLRDRTIVMPFDGVVDQIFVDKGEYVTPGQRLLMVHDPSGVRVEANVKETDIRYLPARDRRVTITVDACPERQLRGYGRARRAGAPPASSRCCRTRIRAATSPRSPNACRSASPWLSRMALLKPGMMVEVEARQ